MELILSDFMPADIFIFHKWKSSLKEKNFRTSRTNKKRMAITDDNAMPSDVNDDCYAELTGRCKTHAAVMRDYSE
jgi:hypothetical protein